MSDQLNQLNAALDSAEAHFTNAETSVTGAAQAVTDAKARVAALPAGDDLTAATGRVAALDVRAQTLGQNVTAIASDAGTIAS